jgi:ABC-2 type transport system ATP-binding protein
LTESPIIQVKHLTKRFSNLIAVNDISFQVGRGEILGLLGPNGAGKTTTIQLLLGLTTPTVGKIRIFDLDLRRHRRKILQRVNFSSAYVSLPSNLTVWENLNVFARLYNVRKPRNRIMALLDLFEMPLVVNQVTGALSSGQLTRLNLCKAFINHPEVLFLDEPTASLDPHIAAKVRSTLKQIQEDQGATMIYTSHNMREVEIMCDRVIFISHGKIIAQGTPSEIVQRAKTGSLEDVFIAIARNGGLGDALGQEGDG